MIQKCLKFYLILLVFIDCKSFGQESASSQKTEKPPKVGNFKLSTSQQPTPLFSLGENVIDAGQVQLFLSGDLYIGNKRITSDITPGVLFAVTDNFSIFLNLPYTPVLRSGSSHSSGLEDFFVQFEYAFYNKQTKNYVDQATLVVSAYAPVGSTHRNPPTGFGSPSLFIGATYNHMLVDWFAFASPGALLTTSTHHTKFGNQFFYEFGFGRNIPSSRCWILAWMVEFIGIYSQKNRIHGKIDTNSGGNVIFINPSIFISNSQSVFQFGFGVPVLQNLFGNQKKFDYMLDIKLVQTF